MLTNRTDELVIELAQPKHLVGAKQLSDRFRQELGFTNRAILQKAIEAGELLVAWPSGNNEAEPAVVGFVLFYVRRDALITLYSIVVEPQYQSNGLGRRLFEALVDQARLRHKTQIQLKCPVELKANLFYEHLGLEITRVEAGKLRPLNIWFYQVEQE